MGICTEDPGTAHRQQPWPQGNTGHPTVYTSFHMLLIWESPVHTNEINHVKIQWILHLFKAKEEISLVLFKIFYALPYIATACLGILTWANGKNQVNINGIGHELLINNIYHRTTLHVDLCCAEQTLVWRTEC